MAGETSRYCFTIKLSFHSSQGPDADAHKTAGKGPDFIDYIGTKYRKIS